MDHDLGLLRIGVFSTLSRISIRMLRHYQNHGVLIPAWVDQFSGHRFYHPDQLVQARRVVLLRDAGFSIEQIAELAESSDPSTVTAAITAQREKLSQDRAALHARLVALDQVNITLKGKPDMTEVATATLPEMHVLSLRKVIPGYFDEGDLWREFTPLLQGSGAALPADGMCGATFHDQEYRESDVDVEVWERIVEPVTVPAPLVCYTRPATEIVTATMRGNYSQMTAVEEALGAYIAERGLTTGPMFNIYRVGPVQDPDPSNWVTEVCLPIVKG